MTIRSLPLLLLLATLLGCATQKEAPEPIGKVDRLGEIRQRLEADPGNAELHLEYGKLLAELGNYAEAMNAYERAIEKRPDFTPAYVLLGDTLEKLGNHKGAVGAYETALDFAPTDRTAIEGLMVAAKEQGDAVRVLDAARRLADLDPTKPEVVAGYGALLLQYEQYPEAAEVYQRVIQLDASVPGDHYNLGLCRYQMGDLVGAEAAWLQAIAIDPDFASANRGLAVLHFDRQHYDSAWEQVRNCAQRGIPLDPEFLKALEAAAPVFQNSP